MLVGIDASFADVYCQVVQVCGVTGYSSCWCLDYELYLDYYPLYGLVVVVVVVFVVVVVVSAGCAFVANRYAVQEASFSILHPVKPTPQQHHHETNNCLPSLILIRSYRRYHHGEDVVGGEHPRYHPNHNHNRQSQIHSRE